MGDRLFAPPAAEEKERLLPRPQGSVDRFREPITLSWENVKYGLTVKTGVFGRGGTTYKQILQDVSGIAKPGQTLAILGSTGAGKSTLLDILAGREKRGDLEGQILVNGKRLEREAFNRISGYVTQDDCLMGTQTVRETLTFYANMKLPSSYTAEQKREKVEQVIVELGLTRVADSLIGTQFMRGISGGEKKRVSIGCELITNPSLLFCDEPTTGLDAYNAMNVMENLTNLACRKGYTVVCTIHQPRSTIFELFDQLMILSQGQVVYFGPAKEAVGYFTNLGYACRPFVNPADYFMDVVVENEKHAAKVLTLESGPSTNSIFESKPEGAVDVREAWLRSSNHQALMAEVREASSRGQGVELKSSKLSGYATNIFKQTYYLSKRCFSNYIRTPMTTYVQLSQTIVMALLVGSLYFRLNKDEVTTEAQVAAAFQDREGALFFMITNQAFSSFASLNLFLQERELFHRERESGTYRTSSYFFSKTIVEAPLQLFFPILFGVISYWMIGFQSDPTKFAIYIAGLITFMAVAASVFMLIGALAPNIQVAQILAPIFTVLFLLFGGFYVNNNSVPVYYRWIQYISYFRYGYQIVTYNELSGLTFSNCQGCSITTGDQELEYLGMGDVSLADNFGYLLAMIFVYRSLALFCLHFLHKNKN